MTNNYAVFNNQFYDKLKRKCTLQNEPFLDETFPPSMESLSPSGVITNLEGVSWKRPIEICENPCMFIDGVSTRDVCQGQLGNCWFISSMAVLALHPSCLEKVIPAIDDQETLFRSGNKSAGIFRFRFWRYGEWVEVVIDDYLPTRANKLMYAHSKEINEFWSALLEKAYAKVCGSYECMIGGQEEEALVDFTGGIPEQVFDLKKYGSNEKELESLYKLIEMDYKNGSLICSSIASHGGETEGKLPNGLITTHAYSITMVARVMVDVGEGGGEGDVKSSSEMIIRIRNPWGQKEWIGDFSDKSKEWGRILNEEKVRIDCKIDNDGEFWMPMMDFVKNFNQMTIVRLIKAGVMQFNTNWFGISYRGYWTQACQDREAAIRGDCGGDQYCIDISKPGGDIVLIHLLQKCPRMMDTYLGLLILKVEKNRQTILNSSKWCHVALEYRLGGSRAICLRYRLPSGRYMIKPYPTQKLKEDKPLYYLLRCFTTQNNHGFKLASELSNNGQCCTSSKSKIISRLRIMHCNPMSSTKPIDALKVFCEIKCENHIFRTECCSTANDISWDDTFLFYRGNPNIPIIIKIVERGKVLNSTIGSVIYPFNIHQLNTKDAITSTDQVLEPNLMAPSRILSYIQTQWYHTDNMHRL